MPLIKDLTSYRFSNAVLPDKFIICGVELKPFCLGHYILLEHIGNPILNPDPVEVPKEDGLYWFFMALIVCSFSYEDAVTLLNDEQLFTEISKSFFDNLMKNMDAEKDWNYFTKINLFKNYLQYYTQMPIYNEENASAESMIASGTDWKTNIYLIFKKMGYDESKILNMNMKKLFFEWCSYAEAEGAIKVWNRVDLEQYKNLKGKK